jgi:cystathionine beta-lyase/cystathionine gamma-synthase
MLSMRVRGGAAEMYAFTNALRTPAIAVSLGFVNSLVYPMPLRDNLMSVGCDDTRDLLADFEQALAAIPQATAAHAS